MIILKVSGDEVEKIAVLSKLYIGEDEKDEFAKNLEAVLMHAEKLNELDTKDVAPTAHILPVKNVFRQDEIIKSMDADILTANAPERDGGCFIVPKVLE